MKTTKYKSALEKIIAAGTLAVALAPFAAADIEKLLPANSTLALAKVENLSALEEKAKTDALVAELRTRIFSKIKEQVAKKDPNGLANVSAWCDALSGTFRGEAVIACTNVGKEFAAVFIADCERGLDVEKTTAMLLNGPDGIPAEKISNAKFGGVPVKVFRDGGTKLYATEVDGKYIFATDRGTMKSVLSSVKQAAAKQDTTKKKKSGIFDSEAFKTARERIGAADVWIYIDGKTIAKVAYEAAHDADEKAAKEMTERKSTEISLDSMISKTQIVKALAPEALNSIWFCTTFDAAKNYPSESSISWNKKTGLIGAFFGDACADGFEKLPTFPVRADFVGVSSVNYSVGRMVRDLMYIGRTTTPMFAALDFGMQNLKAKEGIDIPAWLVALGHGAFSYQWGKNSIGVLTISSDDFAVKSARAIAAGNSGLLVENELDKQPIFTISGYPLSFFARDGKLYLGETSVLSEFASFAFKTNASTSIWNTDAFKKAEATLPAGGFGIDYSHFGKKLKLALTSFAEQMPEGDDFLSAVISGLGDDAFDYTSISKSYLGTNEVRTHFRLIKNAK